MPRRALCRGESAVPGRPPCCPAVRCPVPGAGHARARPSLSSGSVVRARRRRRRRRSGRRDRRVGRRGRRRPGRRRRRRRRAGLAASGRRVGVGTPSSASGAGVGAGARGRRSGSGAGTPSPVSPLMIGSSGRSSSGVPSRTVFMNCCQIAPGQARAVDDPPSGLTIGSRAVGAHPDRRGDRRRVADHPGVGVVLRVQTLRTGLAATSRPPSSGRSRVGGDVLERVGDVVGDVRPRSPARPASPALLEQHRAVAVGHLGDEVRVALDAAAGEGGEADAPGRSGASRTRRCRSPSRCRRRRRPASCLPSSGAALPGRRAARWPRAIVSATFSGPTS